MFCKRTKKKDDPRFWGMGARSSDLTSFGQLDSLINSNRKLRNLIYRPDIFDGKDSQLNKKYNYKIEGKIFFNLSFSKTEIRNVIFSNCKFYYVKFINTKFFDCQFHDCIFIRCNSYYCSFTRVYINPELLKKNFDKDLHANIGVMTYQRLMKNYNEEDQIEHERLAKYQFHKWERYQDWYYVRNEKKRGQERRRRFRKWVCKCCWDYFNGFGLDIWKTLLWLGIAILVFSVVNFCFKDLFGLSLKNWVDSVYYTTVSMSTLGYGDIVPKNTCGRIVASVQSIIGFVFFGLMASVLFRRIAP